MKTKVLKTKYTKQIKWLITCCFCIITVCVFTAPHLSYATTQEDYDTNNDELESLRAEQNEINEDLAEINEQINYIGNQISTIDAKISEKQAAVNDLEASIDQLNIQISDQYASMKLRIQYMYEHNSEDTFALLLASKSLSELLVRTEYVAQISDYDRQMLEQLNSSITLQNDSKIQLTADMTELNSLKSDAEAKAAQLNTLLASIQSDYDKYTVNISEAEALALQYETALEQERIAREEEERKNLEQSGGSSNNINSGNPLEHTESDVAMLAAIIECEAGNQPYDGLLAVGSVIVNRVNDSRFANSIAGVIYAPYQFSPVASGRFAIVLARGATEKCREAAQDVLNGNININALYFHVYRPGIDIGGTVIGDHVFF